MSIKIEREKPKPAPMPPIEKVTVRELGTDRTLTLSPNVRGTPSIMFAMSVSESRGRDGTINCILPNADAIELAFAILEMTGVRDMCEKRTYEGKGRPNE